MFDLDELKIIQGLLDSSNEKHLDLIGKVANEIDEYYNLIACGGNLSDLQKLYTYGELNDYGEDLCSNIESIIKQSFWRYDTLDLNYALPFVFQKCLSYGKKLVKYGDGDMNLLPYGQTR